MSYAAVEQDDTEDRFYTQVEAGDVRLFTLDQLDAAFNAGLIHENTYVCREGDSTWLTLADVAGLGDEEPEPAPISVVAPIPHRGAFAASPSIVPSAPYSVSPMVMPPSIAPVTRNLALDDLDDDMFSKPRKRHGGKIVAGLAVVALGALGFMVVSSGGVRLPKLAGLGQTSAASLSLSGIQTDKPAAKVETPAPTPAPEPVKPEPPKEESKPAETTASSDSKSAEKADADKAEKKGEDRFSDEMKEALLNKDKKQAATGKKSKKAARAPIAAAGKRKPGKAGGGFKAGGSAYDPLNGKL
jgi:hypothetical protein